MNTSSHHHDSISLFWDKIAILVVSYPGLAGVFAGLLAGFLYLFHWLYTAPTDKVQRKMKILGGVGLSVIMGGLLFMLFDSMNIPPALCWIFASVLGSTNIKGYKLLVERAESVAGREFNNKEIE